MVGGGPGLVLADGQTVRIDTADGRIAGTLQLPVGDEPAPVVLMLHGFDGHRDIITVAGTDLSIFGLVARDLAEAGYASLRIDFRGSGESSGRWADTTFSGQIADARAAMGWLLDEPRVDGSRLALLGWSQGGLIAAHARLKTPMRSMRCCSGPRHHPAREFHEYLRRRGARGGRCRPPTATRDPELPWGGETTLRGAFFDEMLTTRHGRGPGPFPGPVQIIMGSRDGTIRPQPGAGEMLIGYHDGPSELVTLDMNHVFDALEGPEVLEDSILPSAIDWLNTRFD